MTFRPICCIWALFLFVQSPAIGAKSSYDLFLGGMEDIEFNSKVKESLVLLKSPKSKSDISKGVETLKKLSREGDPQAQALMAKVYINGFFGISKDVDKQIELLRKSANGKFIRAQGLLASVFLGKRDLHKAFRWAKKASNSGDKLGQFCLGYLYLKGLPKGKGDNSEVPIDNTKGVRLLKESANQGFDSAQGLLASLYCYGSSGLKVDFGKALKYAEAGAKQGDPGSHKILGKLYFEGLVVAKDNFKAMDHFCAAARVNENDAAVRKAVDVFYPALLAKSKDLDSRIKLIKMASDAGCPAAIFDLGSLYYSGQGFEKDPKKAFALWEKASKSGYSKADEALTRLKKY